MGKGDRRSKRGKIFAKSFGKSRPKQKTLRRLKKQAAQAAAAAG
jgi:ribosomal small subunit protein bTHX